MARSAQVAVPIGATATKLDAAEVNDRYAGNTLVVKNTGTVEVAVGGENVTTANGFRLVVGATLTVEVAVEDIYGVVAGATAGAVDVLRVK